MNWYRNSRLASKLIIGSLIGGLSLLLVGAINFLTLERVLTFYHHVASINLPKTQNSGLMRTQVFRIAAHILQAEDAFDRGDTMKSRTDEIRSQIDIYIFAKK